MSEKICFVSNKEPFEYTLSIVSGKWKLKIIYLLACTTPVRYGELKRNISGITHKMLSTQLKELEKEDVLSRKEYPQVPPKVGVLSDKKRRKPYSHCTQHVPMGKREYETFGMNELK